jgi:hypothetical protein
VASVKTQQLTVILKNRQTKIDTVTTRLLTTILVLLLFKQVSLAQTQNKADTVGLFLDFPLVDFPYQRYAANTTGNYFSGYANPSMQQSLAMSNNLYSSAHYGIKKIVKTKNEFLRILFSNGIAAGFDAFTFYSPLGYGWLHEEYHRAVMTRREINSFNDMNTFPFGQTTVSVRKIKDEDLIRISDNHKSDFIRLQTAGLEGQYHQIQTLQKNNFFYNQDLPHIPLYWLSTMTNIIYVNQSGSAEYFDKLIDEVNQSEGSDISKRDFTGPDFTAWTSALFNPNRPYEDRGIHPSGLGINRYIKPSALNGEELKYLQRQGNLQWLNLLSPHLFGFPKIKLKSTEKGDYFGSFAVRHLLTSFGNDISLDIFYQTPKNNFFIALHNYNNFNSTFFGLEGAIIDKPFLNKKLLVSGRSLIWTQPKNQSFTTNEASLGGMLNIKGSYSLGRWFPYIEVEAKTRGWVMGNVFLEDNISLRFGVNVRIK